MGVEEIQLHSLTAKDVTQEEYRKPENPNTGTSRSLDQGRSLPQAAGHAWCSSALSA